MKSYTRYIIIRKNTESCGWCTIIWFLKGGKKQTNRITLFLTYKKNNTVGLSEKELTGWKTEVWEGKFTKCPFKQLFDHSFLTNKK